MLAEILATAPVLKKCDISRQVSDYKCKFKVKYATEGEMG